MKNRCKQIDQVIFLFSSIEPRGRQVSEAPLISPLRIDPLRKIIFKIDEISSLNCYRFLFDHQVHTHLKTGDVNQPIEPIINQV